MKRLFGWQRWSIGTKILVPFLVLSVLSIVVFAYVALTNINELGDHARETSLSLGESAIEDSTAHLNSLGENIISQKAEDVARQVEMYLEATGLTTTAAISNDAELRDIVVQPVGTTGYTALIDPRDAVILIHKYPGQEKDVSPLQETLPSFWSLIEASRQGELIAGYYDWLEVDGSITEKYASIAPVRTVDGKLLTLWATTYIEEFSLPAAETEAEINAAILQSEDYISDKVADIEHIFIIISIMLVIIVTILALALSRAITSPIHSLQKGAREIGQGKLDYKLEMPSQDELGSLADSFNKMSADLKKYIEELKATAAENIAKERIIQENLRRYVQRVNEAQETERKRIARELHDETIQELVVVARHLEELAKSSTTRSTAKIQEEIREIIRGVRRFSQELRPSILDDLGLVPAVEWLSRETTENYGITVKTEFEGDQRQLPETAELTLFRIIQEAVANVRKHSKATEAKIKIKFSADKVRVTVEDNGAGFAMPDDWAELTATGKLGLVGMRERVQLIGGQLKIDSRPGQGTVLTVEIPL
ncbi:MAG: HAMP domain-containing protein [Dehalococcoidia bacterium]|jgi:signal transduction histidine kinase